MRSPGPLATSLLRRIPFRIVRAGSNEVEAPAPAPTPVIERSPEPPPDVAVPMAVPQLFGTPRRLDLSTVDDVDPDSALGTYFRDAADQGIYKWHHYFAIYEEAFGRFKDVHDLRMLEIGVYRGGSLRMWRDYFHPTATIVGIDIDPATAEHADPARGIHVRLGDQADPEFLSSVADEFGPFDIVLDDGGHTTGQMTASFAHLYLTGLKERGVYLIEDTHTNYWPDWISDPDAPTFLETCKALTDRLNEPYQHVDDAAKFLAGEEGPWHDASTDFYACTHSMTFYDSIVCFEKRPKKFPVAEIR